MTYLDFILSGIASFFIGYGLCFVCMSWKLDDLRRGNRFPILMSGGKDRWN